MAIARVAEHRLNPLARARDQPGINYWHKAARAAEDSPGYPRDHLPRCPAPGHLQHEVREPRHVAIERPHEYRGIGVVGDEHSACPGDGPMTRVLACKGDHASIEVYLPLKLTCSGDDILNMPPTHGYYALDLGKADKGKPLEPVLVSISTDKKFVIVDRYERKLPPTRIPLKGGTVDFDQRSGRCARCGEFNSGE